MGNIQVEHNTAMLCMTGQVLLAAPVNPMLWEGTLHITKLLTVLNRESSYCTAMQVRCVAYCCCITSTNVQLRRYGLVVHKAVKA